MASQSVTSKPKLFHRLKRFLMHSRRRAYRLRAFIPGLSEHHRLEAMVGPLGFWAELQRYHLQLLQRNGLQPQHTLLDIGCGPLQGGIAFINFLEAGCYVGFDIDPVRIDAAHGQIARHRLSIKKPRVVVSSTFGDQELFGQMFDFMWASQILYYFKDDAMNHLLNVVRGHLNPGGRFLADTFPPDHYEFHHPEYPGRYVLHTEDSLSALAAPHGLKVRCLGVIGDYGYPRRLSLRSNPLFEITHA